MILVLDSSAMIAYLRGEPEGETVRALLESARQDAESAAIFAHSVNLAEVFYHVLNQTQSEALAEDAIAVIRAAGVAERNDMDDEFWREIARLIHAARALPSDPANSSKRSNLALGDAFGVCLANRLSGDFVTKDRSEIEPLSDTDLVSAFFIR